MTTGALLFEMLIAFYQCKWGLPSNGNYGNYSREGIFEENSTHCMVCDSIQMCA